MEILFWVPVKSPDCLIEASKPTKATSLGADSKRDISPISPTIDAPKTLLMPVMVVIIEQSD